MIDFRLLSLLLITIWLVFWRLAGRVAHRKKSKTRTVTIHNYLDKLFLAAPMILTIPQLLGVDILPFPSSIFLVYLGFVLHVVGTTLSIWARITLGHNWVDASEYQIKKDQDLITSGPYAYIRHPIYTALIIIFAGLQLIVQSFLVVPVVIYITLWAYTRARREERLLTKHFGKKYVKYQKNSSMLIPALL